MKKFLRRDFIKTAGAAAAAAAAAAGTSLLSGCGNNEQRTAAINTDKVYEWKMVTTWPPHFPILGERAELIAEMINKMSAGRIKIQVYGGGELVPALEVFDAVSQGVAEMGHGAAYYWAGKVPAAQFFTGVPFGMNTQQTNAWLFYGGGNELWEETYANYNLLPMPAGNTGGQMGGWFNREINSASDLKGLKIRMPGLGGRVITKAGAASILSPAGELYTNLERGVIDALEWVGPYHDHLMGFHKIAKYYYYPGWQEPTGTLELLINKKAFEQLSDDLKAIVRTAATAANTIMLSEFEKMNSEYYQKMLSEGVKFREYPQGVLLLLKKYTDEVLNELTSADKQAKKIYDSYLNFKKQMNPYTAIIERNYI